MTPIPETLAEAFKGKLTITAPELCRVLPMDTKTLRAHIRAGNITYLQLGVGDTFPRKAFTLAGVLRFLESRERTVCPTPSRRSRPTGAMPPGFEETGITALLARVTAERKAAPGGIMARAAMHIAEKQLQRAGAPAKLKSPHHPKP